MTNIQKAQAILDKWRAGATPGPWTAERRKYTNDGYYIIGNCPPPRLVADVSDALRSGIDVPLIAGTAGNPELLDAIDMELSLAVQFPEAHNTLAKRMAAAIIAADERMKV